MTMPTYLPGVVSKPQVSMEQRVVELENRLSEFMRRDLSSAGIGLGGKLRVLYGSGTQAVLIGTDPADDKPKIVINDPAGNVLYATDTVAGWGLASPETPIAMYSASPGVVFTSFTTDTLLMTGAFSPVNSSFEMQWAINTQWGSGAAAQSQSWVLVSDPVSGWSKASPMMNSGMTTGVLNEVSPPFAFTFPSDEIAKRCYVDLYGKMLSGGAPSTVGLATISCTGISRTSALALGAA
jgi:hypothetical protein